MTTEGRYRTSTWQVVLYNAKQQTACWCGMRPGHTGWLVCAEQEAARLDASPGAIRGVR